MSMDESNAPEPSTTGAGPTEVWNKELIRITDDNVAYPTAPVQSNTNLTTNAL